MARSNRYSQIIESIFLSKFETGQNEVVFARSDIESTAASLGIELPKNLGDIVYSFRYRTELPRSIVEKAPKDRDWIIRPAGRSLYKFVLVSRAKIVPSDMLLDTKIPDATPGVIEKYALNDEQALLAKLRYNRLIDIFTGLTCYSLQNHLRTAIPDIGQVETDEVYMGIDENGAHFIITVQAKGGADQIGVVQIEQDLAICQKKFSDLIPKLLAAQFIENNLICIFEFVMLDNQIKVAKEKHYRLVPPDQLSHDDLMAYKSLSIK